MRAQVYFEDVSEGQEIPSLKKNCSTQQLVQWAAALPTAHAGCVQHAPERCRPVNAGAIPDIVVTHIS